MKKITLTLSALIVAAGMYAQEAQWGIKGGLNIAQETVSDGETGARTGIHLGGFMEKLISNGVDLQLELLYTMQGGTYKIGSNNYTDKFDYLNVPVIFKIYVNKNRRFSIDIGPQLGFMVSAKYTTGNRTVNVYDNDDLNKFEVAVCLGISYKINDKFDFIFHGTGGLTPIVDGEEHKNSGIRLGVGYRF